ncbi:hypothetical protein DL96DRAFT_1713464 [Flagelloscypha sp. PMI_526]|nr:hypothetical protein DL96DRAFT_1713464 [Flagelloscypha sp. PMI_526]
MSLIVIKGKDASAPKTTGIGEAARYTSSADPTTFYDFHHNVEDAKSISLPSLSTPHESRYYTHISTVGPAPSGAHVLFVVSVEPKDTDKARDEVNRWYEEEHIPLLSKVPGFIRARRYKLENFHGVTDKPYGYITLYEAESPALVKEQGLIDATLTPWYKKVYADFIVESTKELWILQG